MQRSCKAQNQVGCSVAEPELLQRRPGSHGIGLEVDPVLTVTVSLAPTKASGR